MDQKTVLPVFVLCLILSLILPETANATHSFQCKGTAMCLEGKVTRIVDGDTLVLNNSVKIRLALVDAPEKKDKFGWKRAKDFTSQSCLSKQVKVDQDDRQKKDRYGRILGAVYCEETNLNKALIDSGLANGMPKYCKKSEFSQEEWAKPICEKISIKIPKKKK